MPDNIPMAKAANMAGLRRSIEQADFENLPKPLAEELSPSLHAVVQNRLLGDNPQRYSRQTAESLIVLPKERKMELMKSFGPRLKRVPFTVEGFPSTEEVQLTKDLWTTLNGDEQRRLLYAAAESVSKARNVAMREVPDQTPYVQRLLHRSMQITSREA